VLQCVAVRCSVLQCVMCHVPRICECKDRQRMCECKDRRGDVCRDKPVMSFALQCVTVSSVCCSALQCVAALREGKTHNVTRVHERHRTCDIQNVETDSRDIVA